ncbi:MAG: DUF1699 family protein [archaeon]
MDIIRDNLKAKERIGKLDKNTRLLHITHAFSKKDFEKILSQCSKLDTITFSKSTKERLSKNTLELLKKKQITNYTKNEQGRAIEIDAENIQKILKMYKDHSFRELEEILGIPKSTIHYFIKHSKRKKIKEGKKIIYLK